MPLLGKEVLAAYVCSTLVTRKTAIKNLSLGCQLPKPMRILSGTCAGLILFFWFGQICCVVTLVSVNASAKWWLTRTHILSPLRAVCVCCASVYWRGYSLGALQQSCCHCCRGIACGNRVRCLYARQKSYRTSAASRGAAQRERDKRSQQALPCARARVAAHRKTLQER